MTIRNVLHRGLRRFIARDDASGLPPAVVERVRAIVTFLQEMEDPGELRDVPGWRVHRLAGDRRGTWSLTVTRNWRLTFRIDRTANEIVDLDYEDYHGKSPTWCAWHARPTRDGSSGRRSWSLWSSP
jgi:proteic killer suppression protein